MTRYQSIRDHAEGLVQWERDLLDDMIAEKENEKVFSRKADRKDMGVYSNRFVTMLGSIYANLRGIVPFRFGRYWCQPSCFGYTPSDEWITACDKTKLRELINELDRDETLKKHNALVLYHGNTVLIIKPSALRFWTRTKAIQDADDVLRDLYRRGY